MDPKRLSMIPLFASLSKKEREQVSRWADEIDVAEGKHLVDQGDFGYEFFAILGGTAAVRQGDEHVAELGPGDFFGEIALVRTDRRTASVVATTPMQVVVMLKRDFKAMADEMPQVATQIRKAVEERA